MSNADVLVLAVARYLCRHRSVGMLRLVDDVAKHKEVLRALGLGYSPPPDTPEWWKTYRAVVDAVRTLEAKGLVKYIASIGVVNWEGRPCL